jgi:hypothetical protein
MNKQSLVNEKIDFQKVGEQISHELGAKMVKDFNNANSLDGFQCSAIGKDIILKALAQPGCIGIRFYDAINESGQKTLVCVGIDSRGDNIVDYKTVNEHGDITVIEGMVFDKSSGTSTNWW